MKAAVIVFPGSNCDRDTAVALQDVSGRAPAMVWHRDTELPDLDLIVVPGGFAHGDYLRPGAMASQSPVMREVVARAEAGVLVLGICNGLQVLTECGLLPGALMRNRDLKFLSRPSWIRVERTDTPFTASYAQGQVLEIPIAHHDGCYYADDRTLDRLTQEGAIAFRYVGADGAEREDAEGNPNGSARAIAGLYNERRNVLGLMPHPERACDPIHATTDGRPLFESLVSALG